MPATASRSAASSTSASTTCMPSTVRRPARLRPIPLAAPVTTATRPSSGRARQASRSEQHARRLGERVVVDDEVLRGGVEVTEAALQHARTQGVGAGRGVGEAAPRRWRRASRRSSPGGAVAAAPSVGIVTGVEGVLHRGERLVHERARAASSAASWMRVVVPEELLVAERIGAEAVLRQHDPGELLHRPPSDAERRRRRDRPR